MTEHAERDALHRASVAARWREIEAGKIRRVIEIVNGRAIPLKAALQERINCILNAAIRLDAKFSARWDAVDEIGALAALFSACLNRCSHCCHIPVVICEQEAELIARCVGIKPGELNQNTRRHASGYDQPCRFMKKARTRIYALHPIARRKHWKKDSVARCHANLWAVKSQAPWLNM